MTLLTTTTRITHEGNGFTTSFPFVFKILAATDLRVAKLIAGVETVLVFGTDYSVSGVGNPNGGSVEVFGTALAIGSQLVIERVTGLTQQTDLRNQGEFFPETHETVFDRLTAIAQEHAGVIGTSASDARVLRLGSGDVDGAGSYRAKENRIQDVGTPLATNDAVRLGDVELLISDRITGGMAVIPSVWQFTGNGVLLAYPVPGAPASNPWLYEVYIGGIRQQGHLDYSVDQANATVFFSTPPPVNAAVLIIARGYSAGLAEITQYTSATLPVASVTYDRKFAVVKDAGQPAVFKVCLANGPVAGGYVWRDLAFGDP